MEMTEEYAAAQSPVTEAAKPTSALARIGAVYRKLESIIGGIIMFFYRIRKVFMAAPVLYAALRLANYNMANLPETVGIDLQASGEFAQQITRQLAVMGPLGITLACLLLMFCSRKAMYAWAISIFTLALPVLLLISNRYPA